jgi:hypothetical protein
MGSPERGHRPGRQMPSMSYPAFVTVCWPACGGVLCPLSAKDAAVGRRGSVRLGAGKLDHLGPLLGLFGNELAEVAGRARKGRAAELRGRVAHSRSDAA